MSRTNVILLVVLVVLAGAWLIGRDWGSESTAGPAPRFFSELNKETVDRIEISGGWQGEDFTLARTGSDWSVESAGDYPAKAKAAEKFIDAVYNLRRENRVGASEALRVETQTDESKGRLVRLLSGDTAVAEFRVGKNPKGWGSYQEFFIREESEDDVYRVRTILSEDRDKEADAQVSGFAWHTYVNRLHAEWVEGKIWDLGGAEATELWLVRPDGTDVKLVKSSEDKWELIEPGKDPVPADADAADSILGQIRYLTQYGVVGLYDEVGEQYGFEQPTATLVLTLRKKVEKKEEPPAEGEEGGEGEEGEEQKEPEPEYVTFKRTFEVGGKITRNRDLDQETGEIETEELHCIRIGGEFDDPAVSDRSRYVFVVTDYRVTPLLKEAAEFRQEVAEEPPADKTEGEAEGEAGSGDEPAEPEDEPAEEPAEEEEEVEPPTEQPDGIQPIEEPTKKDPPEPGE